jgi:hypothetical protein
MISEKHSRAARANGARSRGPVTPQGKATSARNAYRHGLLANIVVLSNEDPKVFEELFNLTVQRFSPVDDIEMSMIEELTVACWRLRRGIAMESTLLNAGIAQRPELSSVEQSTAAFCDTANTENLMCLQRYQARAENSYQRALRGLLLLRKLATREAPPPEVRERIDVLPNEPTAANVCSIEDAPETTPEPVNDPLPCTETENQRAGDIVTHDHMTFTPYGNLVFP